MIFSSCLQRYKEVCNPSYDFTSEEPGSSGHFTQLIWRNTNQLGVGRAEVERDGLVCTYIVARYRPAGNFLGEFGKNVFQGNFNGRRCGISRKKSTIEVRRYAPRSLASRPIKRSHIPTTDSDTVMSKKNRVTEEGLSSDSYRSMSMDDSIKEKADAVWMPDLETGMRGSDLAGLVPLTVALVTERNLRRYVNKKKEGLEEADHNLAANFLAKVTESVKNKLILDKKNEAGNTAAITSQSKADAIESARAAFQNMESSIKKSTPTFRPESEQIFKTNNFASEIGKKLTKMESGNARSAPTLNAASLAAQMSQAAQSISQAATSIGEVVKGQSNVPNQEANQANQANDAKTANSNDAVTKFAAAIMAAVPAGGPPGSAASFTSTGPVPPSVAPPVAGQAGNAAAGNLASSNMAAANDAALSKSAEDKKAASAVYTPSGRLSNIERSFTVTFPKLFIYLFVILHLWNIICIKFLFMI